MSNIMDAIRGFRRMAQLFEPLQECAKIVEELGDLEAVANGHKSSAEQSQKQCEELKAAAAELELAIAKRKEEAAAEVKALLDDAKAKKESTIAAGEKKAAKIVAEADAIASQQGEAVANAIEDLKAAEAARDSLKADTEELERRADAARAYLAKLAIS